MESPIGYLDIFDYLLLLANRRSDLNSFEYWNRFFVTVSWDKKSIFR